MTPLAVAFCVEFFAFRMKNVECTFPSSERPARVWRDVSRDLGVEGGGLFGAREVGGRVQYFEPLVVS